MALVIIKPRRVPVRIIQIAIALVGLVASWFSFTWNFSNMLAARSDPGSPEARIVTDWLARNSPSDPAARTAAGLAFERSFDARDVERSVTEYSAAAGIAPNNYVHWLNLARARNLTGDEDGTIAATERALDLAPNYALVQWAYGNTLLRQGRINDGLTFLSKAAAARADYSRPAALIALQMLNGDIEAARNALGRTDAVNASMADALASTKRFDEAVSIWQQISDGARLTTFAQLAQSLRVRLIEAKQFRLASRVAADAWETKDRPQIGRLTNGSFESDVKLRDPLLFEWQISEGPHPQIGIAEGQAFAGEKNLFLLFGSFESAAFRSVSQTVPVEPGGQYELTFYYRSDVRSEAQLVFEIANACEFNVLASTRPMVQAGEWTPVTLRFAVPATCDGVIIRLNRTGCAGPSCPMHGRLSLDEFVLAPL